MIDQGFTVHHDMSPARQLEWIDSIRTATATIEFLTWQSPDELDDNCPWRGMPFEVTHGTGPRPGYLNRQPNVWVYRVPYDRSLIFAMQDAGGLFGTAQDGGLDQWNDVDVYFLDARGLVIGAVVSHEGIVLER